MKKLFISISLLVLVVIFSGCKQEKNHFASDTQKLAEIVYTASIEENANQLSFKNNKNVELSNDFYYSSFRIVESFGFTTNLDFVMTPYLDNYVIGEDIFIVIALLEFTKANSDNIVLFQKMIIFVYQDEVFGFMSPSASSNISNTENRYNDVSSSDDIGIKIKYEFGSYVFLTEEAIVKYYQKTDTLYDFTYIEDNNETVLITSVGIPFDQENNVLYRAVISEDEIIELNNDVVIDLINLSIIKKVEIVATIVGFDDEYLKKYYLQSDEYPTLKSVYCNFAIIDKSGNYVNPVDLKIGDEVIVYYYVTYQPVDIIVDNIYVK